MDVESLGALDAFERVDRSAGWPPFAKGGGTASATAAPSAADAGVDVVISSASCSFHADTGIRNPSRARSFVECAFRSSSRNDRSHGGGARRKGDSRDVYFSVSQESGASDDPSRAAISDLLSSEKVRFDLSIAVVRLADTFGMWLRVDDAHTFILNHGLISELRWKTAPDTVAEFCLPGLMIRIHHASAQSLRDGVAVLVEKLKGPPLAFATHCRHATERMAQRRRELKTSQGQHSSTMGSSPGENSERASNKCSGSSADSPISGRSSSISSCSNSQSSDASGGGRKSLNSKPHTLLAADVAAAISDAQEALAASRRQLNNQLQALRVLESPLAVEERHRDAEGIRARLAYCEGAKPGDLSMAASHTFPQSSTAFAHGHKLNRFGATVLATSLAQRQEREHIRKCYLAATGALGRVKEAVTALMAELMKPDISQRPNSALRSTRVGRQADGTAAAARGTDRGGAGVSRADSISIDVEDEKE